MCTINFIPGWRNIYKNDPIQIMADQGITITDELKKLVQPGVALADVTQVWTEMLRQKPDFDLTGNGLNHPNDFGHRLYAQALLQVLAAP